MDSNGWSKFAAGGIAPGERVHGNVNGRFVTALRLKNGKLKCIDSTCYHAGGPLGIGDLEDVNGETCIKCPWHAYSISLEDGGKFYESLALDKATKKLVPAGWRKKEKAQRVHEIEERSGGEVWIRLNQTPEKYDSDDYAGSFICAERVMAGDISGQKKGRDGVMPTTSSGQVFSEQRWKPCKVVSIDKDGSRGVRIKINAGPTFKPKPYPMLMMDAAELFGQSYVVVRIGSVQRYYTPIIGESDDENIVTLSVRVYPGSLVGSSLARLKVGDIVEMRKQMETDPPAVRLGDLASAHFLPQKLKRVLLIAGGSGVTPLLAVCHSILENTPDAIVTFMCFDQSSESVLCRDVLARMASKHRNRLIIVRAFSAPKTAGNKPLPEEAEVLNEQRLTPDLIKKFIFPKIQPNEERILISWCGPPKFTENMEDLIRAAGFATQDCFLVPFLG